MSGKVLSTVLFCALFVSVRGSDAQETHQHHEAPPEEPASAPQEREASGTSWLPDATPMYAIHGKPLGGWETMLHGVGFLQYIKDEQPRGRSQVGSINWLMASARRKGVYGDLSLRGMISVEPATIRGCGYPDLLASGEVCEGRGIVDQQHPHDFLMEAAALYNRPLAHGLDLQLYGGLAGEPALGPVAFPHRISAMPNPIAPVSHHWLDASHITFGVVTAGLQSHRWKIESSVFNGREPDEHRWGVDLAALDSYSGRLAFMPTARWSLQVSAGHLEEAEVHDATRQDVNRITASAIHHVPRANAGLLATTAAWGRNVEDGVATHAFVLESSLSMADRHVVFGRAEAVQKSRHDLDLDGVADPIHLVGKLQAGYSRFLDPVKGWRAGLGVSASMGIVSDQLRPTYGGRAPFGFAVFVTVRPAAMVMN